MSFLRRRREPQAEKISSPEGAESAPFFSLEGIPPTLLSILGTAAACIGIKDIDTFRGFVVFALGSVVDAFDGKLARATNGETELGKLVDHVGDKIKAACTLWVMCEKKAAPKIVLGGVALANSVNAFCSVKAYFDNPDEPQTPEKSGKLALAGEFASLIFYAASHFAKNNGLEKVSKATWIIGHVGMILTAPFIVDSGVKYIKRARLNRWRFGKFQWPL